MGCEIIRAARPATAPGTCRRAEAFRMAEPIAPDLRSAPALRQAIHRWTNTMARIMRRTRGAGALPVRRLAELPGSGLLAGQQQRRRRPRVPFALGFTLLLVQLMLRPGACRAAASDAAPFWVSLPSPVASGIPANDRIWLLFHPAWGATDRRSPAVVLLHPLGEGRLKVERQFARYLARQGIACAVMVLPYTCSGLSRGSSRWTGSPVWMWIDWSRRRTRAWGT